MLTTEMEIETVANIIHRVFWKVFSQTPSGKQIKEGWDVYSSSSSFD